MLKTVKDDKKAMANIAKLRFFREQREMTRAELAKAVNLGAGSIRDYETGRFAPTIKSYNKLAEFFGWETAAKQDNTFKLNEIYVIDDYAFRYVGREGIHYCFVEVKNGWSRIYTDYQLLGKELWKKE